jgi:cobalt/nickel transport system permease protein
MLSRAFSEEYARREGVIQRMDAGSKLIFTSACIVLSIASARPHAPAFVGALCLVLLIFAGAPARAVALRMAGPLLFASAAALMQAFIAGGRPLLFCHVFSIPFSLSEEGLFRGVLVLARVFGSVSAVLLLTMTTPAHRLLSGAARLKVPRGFVEVSLFAYRYVFVLLEDAVTVYNAQRARLGYSSFARGLRSLGALMGTVFLRAYGQAEATGASMAMRGYTGEYLPASCDRPTTSDVLALGAALTPILLVFIWTY